MQNFGGYVPPTGEKGPIYPSGLAMGYPSAPVGPGMDMKSSWTPRREKKLALLYKLYMTDGVLTPKELQDCLKRYFDTSFFLCFICSHFPFPFPFPLLSFGYSLSDMQALQMVKTMDTNQDGHIDFEEFRVGMKELVTCFPKKHRKHSNDKKHRDKEKEKGQKHLRKWLSWFRDLHGEPVKDLYAHLL
jgi:hypothetical protein